jgi:hypothetical protein
MEIEVEIHTITDTWITHVDTKQFADRKSGAAAGRVRDRIKAGEPIEVRAEDDGGQRHAPRSWHMAVFNPGNLVAVVEKGRPRRPW